VPLLYESQTRQHIASGRLVETRSVGDILGFFQEFGIITIDELSTVGTPTLHGGLSASFSPFLALAVTGQDRYDVVVT
jgi:hypothetical protein